MLRQPVEKSEQCDQRPSRCFDHDIRKLSRMIRSLQDTAPCQLCCHTDDIRAQERRCIGVLKLLALIHEATLGEEVAEIKGAVRMPHKEVLQRRFIAGMSQTNCTPVIGEAPTSLVRTFLSYLVALVFQGLIEHLDSANQSRLEQSSETAIRHCPASLRQALLARLCR
ncbi:hypothetical protein [Mesorhizobium sp. M1396]|uniref:hypothetical protein n=1 Tax=Mesorhizobium sp. M1396 TaxID=2957095 RepID=UPI0033368394